jgi:hypothetical protein
MKRTDVIPTVRTMALIATGATDELVAGTLARHYSDLMYGTCSPIRVQFF